MKKIAVLSFIFVFAGHFLMAFTISENQPFFKSATDEMHSSGNKALLVINAFDSVYFDLALATSTSSTIEIPVYLRSDDVINALDFSMKYDHTKLDYDTTINMTNYIDALSFYNSNDSTVRLTSYSFSQPYDNDSILFIIKFNILSGQLCSGDLNSVTSLLNGDACSNIVVECLNSGISESESTLNASFYPNPANDFVEFEFEKITELQITDAHGKLVYTKTDLKFENSMRVDIDQWKSGMYFVRFINGKSVKTEKLIVE